MWTMPRFTCFHLKLLMLLLIFACGARLAGVSPAWLEDIQIALRSVWLQRFGTQPQYERLVNEIWHANAERAGTMEQYRIGIAYERAIAAHRELAELDPERALAALETVRNECGAEEQAARLAAQRKAAAADDALAGAPIEGGE